MNTHGYGVAPVTADQAGPQTLPELIRLWVRRMTLPALAVSVVIHLLLMFGARFVLVGHGSGGGQGPGPGGPVEMAVMTESELVAVEAAAMSLETPVVPDVLPQVNTAVEAGMDAGPGDANAGGGSEIGDVGPLAGGGDIGSDGAGLGGAGGGGTSFFGVEAQGNRFAYVVDVSGSMGGPKLEALKRELTKSIEGLLETSEFMIVQYSNPANAKVVGEAGGWQQASPAGKRSIKPHIGLLEAMGSTFPLPAFEKLAEIKPRPDVVYFLTDGDFNGDPDQVTDEILKLVLPWKIPVHTICVDTEGSEARMRRIAKQTRGTFTMIRGTGGNP